MRRVLIRGSLIVAALLLLAFAVTYPRVRGLTNVGAGYVAMQMCSCVEVSGRPYEDCLLDMLPEMDSIDSEPVDRNGVSGVRAWVPLYSERIAWHRPPNGCTLE